MKILITGSNGFIGRAIVNELAGEHDIIGCGTKSESAVKVDEYIRWNIADEEIPSGISDMRADAIIHTAASLDKDDRNETLVKTNCLGTHRIYALARRISVKRVIYLSSIPIIGEPLITPIKESAEINPITMYHATKVAGEYILNQLTKEGIDVIHLRIPSPIGPGMPAKTIVPIFLKQAIKGEALILAGKGARQQNYIDVRDIAYVVRKMLDRNISGGVYHAASKETVSNYELARMCIQVTESTSKIKYSSRTDPYDGWTWDIDISKLTEAIGGFNKHSIWESLRDISDTVSG